MSDSVPARQRLTQALAGGGSAAAPVGVQRALFDAQQAAAAAKANPNAIFNAQEGRRQDREQMLENAARLAQSRLTAKTTGSGYIVERKPQLFDCSFVEEPSFTSGAVLQQAPNAAYRYPLCNAGVYKWEKNARGHYIGAYMYFVVTIEQIDTSTTPTRPPSAGITHHLLFQGIAIKDLPEGVMVGLEGGIEANRPPIYEVF